MKRIISRRTALIAAASAVGIPTIGVPIAWVSASPGDLEVLAPYHARWNYNDLIAGITAKAAPDRFTFVVLGDTRSNLFVSPVVFEQAVAEKPVMIFHTGDLIRGGTVEEYLESYIPLLEIADPIPVLAVPGNHERGDRHDFAAFKAIYGDTQFSFDFGGCRFVGINASEKVCLSGSDLAYLDAELAKPGVQRKYVFFHVPPKYFEIEIATDDRRGIGYRAEELRAILEKHQVNEVFMAHIHGYASKVIGGVRYTLTAGGGASFSTRLPEEAKIFHLMAIHVSPGGIEQELVYRKDGEWVRRQIY